MSAAIALLVFGVAGAIWILGRALGRMIRRRRPGLPPPDRAAVRDCFNPLARRPW